MAAYVSGSISKYAVLGYIKDVCRHKQLVIENRSLQSVALTFARQNDQQYCELKLTRLLTVARNIRYTIV